MWGETVDSQKGLDADCFNSSSLISNLDKNEILPFWVSVSLIAFVTCSNQPVGDCTLENYYDPCLREIAVLFINMKHSCTWME